MFPLYEGLGNEYQKKNLRYQRNREPQHRLFVHHHRSNDVQQQSVWARSTSSPQCSVTGVECFAFGPQPTLAMSSHAALQLPAS